MTLSSALRIIGVAVHRSSNSSTNMHAKIASAHSQFCLSSHDLGPAYLCWLQFVLDMQFVIQVASHGRYSSRHMRQVVSDIISRAVNALATTGMDPNRWEEYASSLALSVHVRLLTDSDALGEFVNAAFYQRMIGSKSLQMKR